MSRPLRITFPGAWYHVMNRGAGRQKIFRCNEHYQIFIDLLREIHRRYQVEIHAYCLMSNHYHLLICTPLPNISRAMRHLDGLYTQRYNRTQNRDGALLRGRYKSIIVDANNYLLQLSRYIHLNPVTANLVKKPGDYLWSSYTAYMDPKKCPDWLSTKMILSKFSNTLQKQKYRKFVGEGVDHEICSFFNKIKLLPIIGSEAFIKTISQKYLDDKEIPPDITEHKLLNRKIEIDDIIKIVGAHYKVTSESILIGRRRVANEARVVAIYLACKVADEPLCNVAKKFSFPSYVGASKSYYRANKKIACNEMFANEVRCLEEKLLIQGV